MGVFGGIKVLNNFNRSTTRLFYKARPPFGRPPKDCGWWHPVVGPQGGTPVPTLSRRFRGSGSQRVPLSTVMDANGGADAGHKRRLENRLMVRRRDPHGSRQRGPRVRRTFESVLRSRSILPRASGHHGNIKVFDLTGRRGSFARSSLLCFVIGQIRRLEASDSTDVVKRISSVLYARARRTLGVVKLIGNAKSTAPAPGDNRPCRLVIAAATP